MTDIPHFALPFRFADPGDGNLAAVVTEQDSADEIADCVEVCIRTVQGERRSLTEFGRPQTLEFALARDLAGAQLAAAMELAEPRARAIVDADEIDPYDQGAMRLRTMFARTTEADE